MYPKVFQLEEYSQKTQLKFNALNEVLDTLILNTTILKLMLLESAILHSSKLGSVFLTFFE